MSIVDDDHSVRRALRRLVRFAGFTAETFASAEDFLSSASLVRTACLVLDIHLNGGMSGFELQAQFLPASSTIGRGAAPFGLPRVIAAV
jgi:FixJ family two-component response regulator